MFLKKKTSESSASSVNMFKGRNKRAEKTITSIIPPSYFQSHECHLSAEKMSAFVIQCSRLRRFLLDLTTVCADDVRARNMFKSHAALSAEKYRQYLYHPLSIHPFSKLRLWLEVLFVAFNIISNTMLALNYAIEQRFRDYYMLIMYISDGMIMVNILANIFTGYVEGHTYEYVVLDMRKVFIKYTRTWLIVDLLSALSFVPSLFSLKSIAPYALLVSMRFFRVPVVFCYLENVTKAFRVRILLKTGIDLGIYLFTYIMWNIYFQFATEYVIEGSYTPESPRECSWLSKGNLWNATSTRRFIYSMERAIAMLRKNSNLKQNNIQDCHETFYLISWSIAKILIYHCALKYTVSMYGQESAAAKYFTMTKQVEMYMTQRGLPPRIKKKILKFYSIRYQSSFFVEAPILSCVSGQLREDIIMHTGRQLVKQLAFLQQLPRHLLLQIGFKLKLSIFIAGDIIYKINTIGDCLYFIDKGTVAAYTGSGKEFRHYEDGDHFGEIALALKYRFRTTSTVAVTNCELFRLDIVDFNTCIACYPAVFEQIKKVAMHRYEVCVVLDEHHNIERKNKESYTGLPNKKI